MQKFLESARLILRPWQEADRLPFYQLNADPAVMRYFPKCLTRTESDLLIDKCQALIEQQGWGFWAVELKSEQRLIGLTGLHSQPDQFSFSQCTEIGWRLNKDYWGQGYATEAAQLALSFAF
ncbi:GNAT family N-acetyltransferase, partial [Escherichia coli]|nr:GNAT family N-acetyltransferase [Escherichia coli]